MEKCSDRQHLATLDRNSIGWYRQQRSLCSCCDTSAQKYPGFGWDSPPPPPMHITGFNQLTPVELNQYPWQPLLFPWPSMLGSRDMRYQALLPYLRSPPVLPLVSAGSTGSVYPTRVGHPVRRILSDDDRRTICKYAEECPAAKQVEIGHLFGVDRSTISKILKNKEIYLRRIPLKDASRPKSQGRERKKNKESKAQVTKIKKALSVCVLNELKEDPPISDKVIREQAFSFASFFGSANSPPNPVAEPTWLEKVKQDHHISSRGTADKDVSKDSLADVENRSDVRNLGATPCYLDGSLRSSSPDTIIDEHVNPTLISNEHRKSPVQSILYPQTRHLQANPPPGTPSMTPSFFLPGDQISQKLLSPLWQQPVAGMDYPMTASSPISGLPSPPHRHLTSPCEDTRLVKGPTLNFIDECFESTAALKLSALSVSAPISADRIPSEEEAVEALRVVLNFLEAQPSERPDTQDNILF